VGIRRRFQPINSWSSNPGGLLLGVRDWYRISGTLERMDKNRVVNMTMSLASDSFFLSWFWRYINLYVLHIWVPRSAMCVNVWQLPWRARLMSGNATTTPSASRRDGAVMAALTAPICQTSSAVRRITSRLTTSVTSAESSDAAVPVSAFTSRGSATRIPTVKTAPMKQTVSWASV